MPIGYGGNTKPVKGALTLEEAMARGREGHLYQGRSYVILAPLGGYYTASAKPRTKLIDGTVVAAFERDGSQVSLTETAEERAIARAVRSYDRANARRGGAESWDSKNERRPTPGPARSRGRASAGTGGHYTGD